MTDTRHLFPILSEKLIALLKQLNSKEWNNATIAKEWTVKDIATHLLDTNLRTLSSGRDKHRITPDRDITEYRDLVSYLNKLNADWVSATKRLSSQILIELLETSGMQCSTYFANQDLYTDAPVSVAWAGEKTSKNWFHIAREFTEKWHHQQQIRDSTDRQGIMTRELFYPVMDTFMYGLPLAYRRTDAADGSSVKIVVETEIGGVWYLVRNNQNWNLSAEPSQIIASIHMDPDTAWKLFTKGITPTIADEKVHMTGNTEIAAVALQLVAVMA